MKKSIPNDTHEFSDGNLLFWTSENSSLHLKAQTAFGDPVELNSEELRELIDALQAALLVIT